MSSLPKHYCEQCGASRTQHVRGWVDGIVSPLLDHLPTSFIPRTWEQRLGDALETLLTKLRILSFETHFNPKDLAMRSTVFIEEGHKHGLRFQALKGPVGYMNFFRMEKDGKRYSFEALPVADFLGKFPPSFIDDKKSTKEELRRGKFPIADSRAFWGFQKMRAHAFTKNIGFPVVIKPRNGSYGRHITTNVTDEAALTKAIDNALRFSPTFVVEKYIDPASVFRATIVDFEYVACLERLTPGVTGDGVHTIKELVAIKNSDPERGPAHEESYTLFQVVIDDTTHTLLAEQNLTMESVPDKDQFVRLQRDPFIRLGADSRDATPSMHPDNKQLFKDIAKHFDTRVVGLDFMCQDISKSWKDQPSAVLELNSLPCIEVHHFPTYGEPHNVAEKIVDLVFKYYK